MIFGRFIHTILFLALVCTGSTYANTTQTKKYASILMDYETGKVLYARGADLRRYPASLTKIMTLYMVFDALKNGQITMDQHFKTSLKATQQQPSRLGLRVGETISVKNIIYTLVTKSANDVSVVIAEALGGSERDFAIQMTQKAREIGMHNTTFRNASGLPNTAQVTTARDMAILGVRILKDFPEYYPMFNTKRFKYKGTWYDNHNKLLGTYEGADGIKTGFINASGFNLVASVKRGDKRLIGVVFGGVSGASRNAHMEFLLDKGFRVYRHLATRPMDFDMIGQQVAQKTILDKPIRKVAEILSPPEKEVFSTRQPYGATQGNTALKQLEENKQQGDWGVQVGAYRNYNSAFEYANQVIGLIPTLQSAKIHIQQRKKRSVTIYQSQVIGLTKILAQSICTTVLDTTALSCVVIDTTQ